MRVTTILAPAIAVTLLAVIGLGALARPAAGDAEPYHAEVRRATAEIPRQIGSWTGRDNEVPRAAQRLLKPNVLLSRIYTDVDTGRDATFVFVHCKDARDMIGHFPPNCYRQIGYSLDSAEPRTWDVNGRKLEGMQYRFSYAGPDGTHRIVIDNLLLLPGGAFARDMEQVTDLASDYTRHFFGAGQMQVVTSARMSEEERGEAFAMLMEANGPLLDALRSDGGGPAAE